MFFINSTYEIEKGKNIQLPLYYCKQCNTFIRQINNKEILSNLEIAAYSSIQNEQTQYNSRFNFFKYLYILVIKYKKSIKTWVDFGCSYGHFIEFIRQKNIECCGIEIADEVRAYAKGKGLVVHENITDLPENKSFDVISLIDSLYYSREPGALMRNIYQKLNENGLIILRMQNRNWLVKYDKYILHKTTSSSLGDVTIGFSKRSIRELLENNDFKILSIRNSEKGKIKTFQVRCFYDLALAIYYLSIGTINLIPGFIVIAKKK